MTITSMKARLRAFERNVYLGVTALAGAGAVAAVTKWQDQFQALAHTRDEFIATTGEGQIVADSYHEVASALESLKTMVMAGDKDAIMAAGMQFYTSLANGHEIMAGFVSAAFRGDDKPPEETLQRVSSVLSAALGLN